MKKEKSCGAIVIKDNKVLLVKHDIGHWGLPKGHVEENESEKETAIRETKEETNIDIKIISEFRKVITYQTKEDTIKDVVFFIGEPINEDTLPQFGEIDEVRFVSFDEAFMLLPHADVKEVLKEAQEYLKLI